MIRQISWQEILPVWQIKLWPKRADIKTHSAMCFLQGYDMSNYSNPATFFGLYKDGNLVAVNSGHGTACGYRSRGLWVDEEYRGQGLGKKLLLATIDQARREGHAMVWSLPRQTSWPVYASVGFQLASDWHATDTSESNAFCQLELTGYVSSVNLRK
jgi:GNAT superfamily N-acetyltransferase